MSRVYQVRRLVRLARRQCRLVAARLDQHGDDYREAAQRAASQTEARDETGASGRATAALETVSGGAPRADGRRAGARTCLSVLGWNCSLLQLVLVLYRLTCL